MRISQARIPQVRFPLLICLTSVLMLSACSGTRPQVLLNSDGSFIECPSSPNCVSSDSTSESHNVAAFNVNPDAKNLWDEVKATVKEMPRTTLVIDQANYLHVEYTSSLMGYVDDLQLQLRAEQGMIAVYSASRLGYSDLGANRERVEQLRKLLQQRELIQ